MTVDLLQQVNNDIQVLVDCVPDGGVLVLDVGRIVPQKRIELNKAITIRSAARHTREGKGKVDVGCAFSEGLLNIR